MLAAGASRRSGDAKALARLDGQPFVRRAVTALLAGGCEHAFVVVGPPHGDRVERALGPIERVCCVPNPSPERGMSTSLSIGLEAVRAHRGGAAVVSLVDHPSVAAETVRALVDAWREGDARVVRPCFEGRRGHPILVDATAFGPLLRLPAGADPRPVLRAAGARDLAVEDPAVLEDLDTPAAIRAAGGEPAGQ